MALSKLIFLLLHLCKEFASARKASRLLYQGAFLNGPSTNVVELGYEWRVLPAGLLTSISSML